MNATVEQRPPTFSASGIRWPRVLVAGILLEFALVAVLVPIGAIFGAPRGLGSNVTQNARVFLTAVPVASKIVRVAVGAAFSANLVSTTATSCSPGWVATDTDRSSSGGVLVNSVVSPVSGSNQMASPSWVS